MRDLRELLDQAGGGPTTELPDIDSIRRRARPIAFRRRVAAVTVGLALAIASWTGGRALGVDVLGHDAPPVGPGSNTYCSEPDTPDLDVTSVAGAEQLPLGAPAWGTEFGFDAAWVRVDSPVDQVVKVDQASGHPVLAVDGAGGLDFASDGVWVVVGFDDVVKIDPVTCATLRTIHTSNNAFDLAVGLDSVWVPSGSQLLRFDEKTGDRLAVIDTGMALGRVVVGEAGVWVTSPDNDRVMHIDPGSNTVIVELVLDGHPEGLALDDTGLWVTTTAGGGTVVHIDPVTDEVLNVIDAVGNGVGITTGGGAVWVSTQGHGVSRIDPRTYQHRVVIDFLEWNYGLAYGEDELWVSSTAGWVYRLPLTTG